MVDCASALCISEKLDSAKAVAPTATLRRTCV